MISGWVLLFGDSMDFLINIANKNIFVSSIYPDIYELCKDYLITEKLDSVPDITVLPMSREDMIYEEDQLQLLKRAVGAWVFKSHDPRLLEILYVHRAVANAMLSFDTLLMHGSVVSIDNNAYMFVAPSGIGKTTRTKLWLELYPSSIVINGDKPLIKITASSAIACGTPWCGKEGWNTNATVPLKAVFLLERTDKEGDSSIEEVSLEKGFPLLLQQTYCPNRADLMKKTLLLLQSLKGKVKIYKFRSSPTKESVRLAYETAKPGK